jgi:hypothetical protein
MRLLVAGVTVSFLRWLDMAERRIEHDFECSTDTYWDIFFSPEFNRSLFVERLRFERWEITSTETLPHGFRRAVEAIPPAGNLPGPIKAILKRGTGYREEGEFHRERSRYELRALSYSLPEKLAVTGTVTVVAQGNGCRRIYDARVVAKIFGLGGVLEQRVLGDMEKSLVRAAEHTRKWLAERRDA